MNDGQEESRQEESRETSPGNQAKSDSIRIAKETLDGPHRQESRPEEEGRQKENRRGTATVQVDVKLDSESRQTFEQIIGEIQTARDQLNTSGKLVCERICDATDCLLEASRLAERQADRLQQMAGAAGGAPGERTRRDDRLGFVRTVLRGLARLRGRRG